MVHCARPGKCSHYFRVVEGSGGEAGRVEAHFPFKEAKMHEKAIRRREKMRIAMFLVVSLLEASPAFGQGEQARPVVVVFFIGESHSQVSSEQRFAMELGLSLDRFDVRRVSLPAGEFATAPMPERLRVIEEHSQRHHAVATTWLEHDPNDRVLLNVVALSTGRALLRIVEARRTPSTEADLALAAEELLGEAYLFESAVRDRAVADIVAKVKNSVPQVESEPDAGPDSSQAVVGLLPFFRIGTGLGGDPGAYLRTGGGMGVEVRWSQGLFGRVGLSVLAGPRETFVDGSMSGVCLSPELNAGYIWPVGPLFLGAVAEMAFQWNKVDMVVGSGGSQSFDWFGLRAAAGLDARIPLDPRLSIVVDGLVGLVSQRRAFRRLSDSSMVIATPRVDWTAVVGLMVWL
jgi:hypothetical protein